MLSTARDFHCYHGNAKYCHIRIKQHYFFFTVFSVFMFFECLQRIFCFAPLFCKLSECVRILYRYLNSYKHLNTCYNLGLNNFRVNILYCGLCIHLHENCQKRLHVCNYVIDVVLRRCSVCSVYFMEIILHISYIICNIKCHSNLFERNLS